MRKSVEVNIRAKDLLTLLGDVLRGQKFIGEKDKLVQVKQMTGDCQAFDGITVTVEMNGRKK